MIIRFEDDIAKYIQEHQQHDPDGTLTFTKQYIAQQIHCIAIAGNALETFAEELTHKSCQEVHRSKKMRLYQCLQGHALDSIILLFDNEEHCRKSTEEIQDLVETAYHTYR